MAHHPLDWNRDGRVGLGDGAITEMIARELEGSSARRDSGGRGGCGCGCTVVFLAIVAFILITVLVVLVDIVF